MNQSENPYRSLPLFFRAAAGTSWVQVNSTGGCDPLEIGSGGDIHDGLDHTSSEVWCFEGPDSLWPAGPGGTSQDNWSHWSRNLPPVPQGSRWHITTLDGNGIPGGNFNAWCGCDSLGTNPACDDVSFWVNKKGYGDEWEQTLIANVENLGASSGGTITFDLRYDTECVYDYLYLEYFNSSTGNWDIMTDGGGIPAVFNGVSNGNGSLTFDNTCDNGAMGTATDGNYYDTGSLAGGSPVYGNSSWYTGVTFPIPAATGVKIRWRGSTDPAWSDQDGNGDTDGIGAVDNVTISFVNGDSFSDNFEFGDFANPTVVGGSASWDFGAGGNTYDGWHLEFDPMYKNKGNTCTFSDDWMWAAKPAAQAIPDNSFEFFLTSPIIPTNGWTGGTCVFSQYQCMPAERSDYTNTHIRIYDT
ncbi:MAG: hypothetical protein HKN73_12215, partial [Gemmatimonadetes bacterium]|nr:hypothetical protein [Gemmatimonadota bacterium]